MTPLTGLHGASHKVLNMALSDLLLIGSGHNPLWAEVAAWPDRCRYLGS